MKSSADKVRTNVRPSFPAILSITADTRIFQIRVFHYDEEDELVGEYGSRIQIDFLRGLREAHEHGTAWADVFGSSITPIGDQVELILAGFTRHCIHINVPKHLFLYVVYSFEKALRVMGSEEVTCGDDACLTLHATWE